MSFLHGVELLELNGGERPISSVSASVIGLVGTAPQGPVNTPTLIAGSLKKAVEHFGNKNLRVVTDTPGDFKFTIPNALSAIFEQTGAMVVVVNVHENGENKSEEEYSESFTLPKGACNITLIGKENKELKENTDYRIDYKTGEISKIEEADVADGIKVRYDTLTPTPASLLQDLKGGVGSDGQLTGSKALLGSETSVQQTPRILIAPTPDFDVKGKAAVASSLIGVAERLRAIVIADGPGTTDEAAKTYRATFGSARLYLVDPGVKVLKYNPDTEANEEVVEPASSRVAGVLVKSDNERGWWWSPSNRNILGISGTQRPIDFALGDRLSSANILNEKDVATIISNNGYRLWGNHSCSSDPKWMFISVRRTADIINDSLLRAHLWAVDHNITKNYIESVMGGVNNYLRYLKSIGAIINGTCWADKDLNTPTQIQQGKIYFDFDFTPPYPAEHITFRSSLVNKYLEEIF
jgi:phage tail sheath protein FI